MSEPWQNSANAYTRSFAHLCAGTVDQILTRLGPPEGCPRLLDAGTGTGTVAAAATGFASTVIGVDRDASMTTLAARRHPQISFVRAALPDLPCADRSFDVITANFVINHTPDPRSAVRELRRALRSNGQLVATIWTSQVTPLNQLWNEVMSTASVSPLQGMRLPVEKDFERSIDGFVGILANAGFGEVQCQETEWIFEIAPTDLWSAVESGIALIGQTYRAQDSVGRERMRAAYLEITRTQSRSHRLAFRSTALIASARR